VVTNLLTNAIKFGRGNPIEVEVAGDDDRARLRVRDAGEGIRQEEQDLIFERFERASNGNGHPGLGLGLWISKRIVEACHGTISVESRQGQGSTFTVQLPRALV
jgi:signal transduction histidine kinase